MGGMVPARISAILLVTDRLSEQRAFYEALGWRSPAPPDATFVPIPLAGAPLVLTSTEAAREEAGVDHRFAALIGVGSADDVDVVMAGGGEIVQPARDRPFGRAGWFRDPIGTMWEVA